jgi:hypothetical protein
MAGYDEMGFINSPLQQRVDATLELIAEMEVLADADTLVCAFTSNVALVLSPLRASRGKGAQTCLSVERSWVPQR